MGRMERRKLGPWERGTGPHGRGPSCATRAREAEVQALQRMVLSAKESGCVLEHEPDALTDGKKPLLQAPSRLSGWQKEPGSLSPAGNLLISQGLRRGSPLHVFVPSKSG